MNQSRGMWPRLALLTAALIWGSSFFIMKNTVDVFPTFLLLGMRFTIGCLVLGVIFFKRLKKVTKRAILRGSILGALLFVAYTVQTLGLIQTTPGKNAFLTAVYCVLVPFVAWIASKKRPDKYNWLAAIMCLAGIGLVSLTGQMNIGIGDSLTLIGGIFYAIHMVAVGAFGQDDDPVTLTIIQFAAAAVLFAIVSLSSETLPQGVPTEAWGGLMYLAVFATAGALLLQNVGQKYTPPAAAAILLSLESVFGVLFSVVFYGEALTIRLICGFLLIFASVLISETKLSFLRGRHVRVTDA